MLRDVLLPLQLAEFIKVCMPIRAIRETSKANHHHSAGLVTRLRNDHLRLLLAGVWNAGSMAGARSDAACPFFR